MKLQTVVLCSLAAATLAGTGDAQTRVDLRTQAKSVDFSSANSTLPSKTGTELPAACQAGETFVKTGAPPGSNWYVCTSTNLWTAQGIELPPQAGNAGAVLSTDGAAQFWQPLGGDIGGSPGSAQVNRILGRALSSTAPATGQVLAWDGGQWSPWTAIGASSVFGRTGAVASQTGDYAFPQIGGTILGSQLPAAGGDLSGGLTAATVVRIQGMPVGSAAPFSGQVLAWDGAKWGPSSVTTTGVPSVFGRAGAVTAQTGDYSFPQIGGTILGSQLPAAGGDLSGSLTAAAVTRIQGQPVGPAAPASGQVLSWDGAKWAPSTLPAGVSSVFGRSGAITAQAGDYSAAQITNAADTASPNAFSAGARQTFSGSTASSGLQIAPSVLPGAAQAGDLTLDAGDSNRLKLYDGVSWLTLTPTFSKSNYSASFLSQATVTIPGSVHQLGTANLIVECYDNATPANRVEPSAITVDPSSYDVVIVFAISRSGRCVINGYNEGEGSGGASGGGSVGSVFGRTGDVVAANGDYAFSEIAGTLTDGQIAGGINASKIGAGTVANRAFGYLANVTSDLQSQLNEKAALGPLSGDVAGNFGSTTVVALQGRAVANIAPSDGQALVWSASANQWQPNTVSGSRGGGSGASMASQLGDFTVTMTSGTVLSIGTNCSTTTPCNVRFGSQVYALTGSATATLASGSGTAYFYTDSSGNLTVQTSLSLSCSGACIVTSSGSGFPVNSIPLYTWSATVGVWDTGGGIDRRGWLSSSNLLAGAGIITVQSGGQTTIAVDAAVVPTYLTGSATLDFPPIPPGACAADLTFTLPGANVGDGVVPGWPGGLEAGLSGLMRVNAPGIIAVRLCADSTAGVNPASATFTATIVRGY
ncbi:MAG: hypothetical protein ABSF25_02300 [Bryobacteraceae bacterium]